jgi:chromosome segregation ATPase
MNNVNNISNYNLNNSEISKLKNELKEAKETIEQQKLTISVLQNQLNNSNNIITNNYNLIQSLQNIINQKEQELIQLKSKNIPIISNQMLAVNFISSDSRVHYAVPCVSNNTFAEIEEKLYQQFPEYRETNNQFLAQGREILRFKTIAENKIGNGLPVTLVVPS